MAVAEGKDRRGLTLPREVWEAIDTAAAMEQKTAADIVSAAILLALSTAGAEQTFKISQKTAFSDFIQIEIDECISTTAFVLGAESIEKPDDPSLTSGAFAGYSSINGCTQDFIIGAGFGGPDTFSMQNLTAATATVPFLLSFFEFNPETGGYIEFPLGPVTMIAQWTAVGPLEHTKIVNVIPLGQGFIKDTFKGNFRDATVQATLILGGQDLIAGLRAASASLGDVTLGQHVQP